MAGASGAGEIKSIVITPTISTSAYASGNQLGTLFTLSQACPDDRFGAVVQSVTVLDFDKRDANFDIIIFGGQPTVSSSDRSAVTFSSVRGSRPNVMQITTYSDLSAISLGFSNAVGSAVQPVSGVDLFGLIVIRSSATYTTSSSLEFTFHLLQDRR